jgi:hypothetical protein
MRPVGHLQIDAILAYLHRALRGDPELTEALRADDPDEIVRGTYRVQPINEEKDGTMHYDATQFPALGLYAEKDRSVYETSVDDHEQDLTLWYVFEAPIDDVLADGTPISGEARGSNLADFVFHRVCYWLRQHALPAEISDDDEVFDLLDEGSIETLDQNPSCDYIPPGKEVGGFKAKVTMTRSGPPYARPGPRLLKLINLSIPIGSVSSPTGPTVEAEIDTDP